MGKMGCDNEKKDNKNTKLFEAYVPGAKLTTL